MRQTIAQVQARLNAYALGDWWTIHDPARGTFELYLCPPQSQTKVHQLYPGCGVTRGQLELAA